MVIPTSQKPSKVAGPQWMQCPALKEDDIIPGLAFIYPLDELIVVQIRDNLHDVMGISGIAYTIFNSEGQKVFLAVLKKKFRYFDVRIFNNYGNEVMNVKGPFSWFTNKVLVWAPPGNYLGSIYQLFSCISTYIVADESDKKVFKIRSESMFQYVYKVYLLSCGEHPIGVLRDNLPQVNANNFGVTFPRELDIKEKITLLGACFLIGSSKY